MIIIIIIVIVIIFMIMIMIMMIIIITTTIQTDDSKPWCLKSKIATYYSFIGRHSEFAVHVWSTCLQYMFAVYVCSTCLQYMFAVHVQPSFWSCIWDKNIVRNIETMAVIYLQIEFKHKWNPPLTKKRIKRKLTEFGEQHLSYMHMNTESVKEEMKTTQTTCCERSQLSSRLVRGMAATLAAHSPCRFTFHIITTESQ